MSPVETTHEWLWWIGFLVVGQLYVIGFLALSTLVLLKWRTVKSQMVRRLKEEYGSAIADVVAGDLILKVQSPKRIQLIRRQALKESLLDHIGSITGPERTVLIGAYISLGLAEIDRRHCKSVFWSRRLEALLCLSQLQRLEFADLFHEMKQDVQPLVSSCAILSLSYIDGANEEPESILDTLPVSFFSNSNLLLELTETLVARHGLERFEDYVKDHAHTAVGEAIISVLTHVGTAEATIFLVEILTTKKFKDERLPIRIERAVRESNDPIAIAQLDYFQSSRGEQRLKAGAA